MARDPNAKLLQQVMLDQDPSGWRMLIGCILLNMARREVADTVWPTLFQRWPDPTAMAAAPEDDVAGVLKPLGLQGRRAKSIVNLSKKWTSGWKDVTKLPGVGRYAGDSWKIFVQGDRSLEPVDKELISYLARETASQA